MPTTPKAHRICLQALSPLTLAGGSMALIPIAPATAASWSLSQTFNNPSPSAVDIFGRSVAISGGNVLVGAFGDDTGAVSAGSAYLFTQNAETQSVRGPLPLLGLGAAFAWSRRLRSRLALTATAGH